MKQHKKNKRSRIVRLKTNLGKKIAEKSVNSFHEALENLFYHVNKF